MVRTRGILVHPHELDRIWIDNAAAMGLNVMGLHPVGGKNADQSLQALLDMREQLAPLLAYAQEKGVAIEYEMHALSWLIPRSLFAKHPQWFREDEAGNRNPEVNMCPSNQEALDYLTQRTADLTAMLPSQTHLYYYWIDDVQQGGCHCEKCRQLSASDQQTLILNAMLKGIRMVDPKGKLAWLAYFGTMQVPSAVKPEEGLFLEYAPIRRSFQYAINDSACEANAAEIRTLPDLVRFFGTEDSKVLEYWTDNSLFSHWTMPPKPYALNAEIMAKDVQWYGSLGFHSITAFGCYLGAAYRALHGMPQLDQYGEILKNS